MTVFSYFGGVVKFLVELVELASYHYRIVRNLTFLLVGVRRSWLNWLNRGIYRTLCQYDTIWPPLRG